MGDRVLMLENSVYSVITPEGCAAILWKDADRADRAAECLRLTATDMKEYNLIDEIVSEPTNWKIKTDSGSDNENQFEITAQELKLALIRNLNELQKLDVQNRMKLRYGKFREMGQWITI
jgi:acetyl-CoA carboxylase carboxyl transferase subunit alpha